jgi:hypothetical protein
MNSGVTLSVDSEVHPRGTTFLAMLPLIEFPVHPFQRLAKSTGCVQRLPWQISVHVFLFERRIQASLEFACKAE